MMIGNKGEGDIKIITNNVDPHKVCLIEADLNRTMESVTKHDDELIKIQNVSI